MCVFPYVSISVGVHVPKCVSNLHVSPSLHVSVWTSGHEQLLILSAWLL